MLRYLDRWEVTLGPGELLFVPAGAAHAVTNLSHTAAISANFVDSTNLEVRLRVSVTPIPTLTPTQP